MQAYYLVAHFPIERAPTSRISYGRRKGGVKVYELIKFPVKGLVFEMCTSLEDLSLAVGKACIFLQNENIPYNVLIADRGSRVFLLPQCFAERQARGEVAEEILKTQVNPAVWEISGHIVLKRRTDYDLATEEYAWKLLAEVSLSPERFEEVKAKCLKAAFQEVSDSDDHQMAATNSESINFKETFAAAKSNLQSNLLDVVMNHGEELSVES